jgi:hypothetical protein
MEKSLAIRSMNTKGMICIQSDYKAFTIALRDTWGFSTGIYLSDEHVEKLKEMCELYLKEVKKQNATG